LVVARPVIKTTHFARAPPLRTPLEIAQRNAVMEEFRHIAAIRIKMIVIF
jgi:hypothetical protein